MSLFLSSSSSSPSSKSKKKEEESIKTSNKYYDSPPTYHYQQQKSSSSMLTIILFLLGSLMGCICWIIGSVILIYALRGFIRYIKYRHHWLDSLQNANYYSSTVKGCVLKTTKSINPITHNITYCSSFEYHHDNNKDNNNNNENDDEVHIEDYEIGKNVFTNNNAASTNTNTNKTIIIEKQLTSQLDAQWLYEYQTYDAIIKQGGKAIFEVKVLDDHPNSGIPSDLFYHKLDDCKLWTKYVNPTISVVCIHIYVIGCILYVWLYTMENNNETYQFWFLLILSLVIAPTLMIPYLLKEQDLLYQQRLKQLQTDPILLVSELDNLRRLWSSLGCTWTKKIHLLLFVIGLIQMVWTTTYLSILGMAAIYFGTLGMATTMIPIQRELLEKYRNHDKASTVDGQIIMISSNNNNTTGRRREAGKKKKNQQHEISIRYSIATNIENDDDDDSDHAEEGGNGVKRNKKRTVVVTTVEKQYLVSQEVYQMFLKEESSTNNNIPIRILNDYPCSGIPVDKLVHDIVTSYTMLGIQCIFWISLLTYLLGCWSILINNDPYYYFWQFEDYMGWFCYIMIGPMLMIPHTSTYHCSQYQKIVDEYLFNGKIVKEERKRWVDDDDDEKRPQRNGIPIN